jgi:hypothetical protein
MIFHAMGFTGKPSESVALWFRVAAGALNSPPAQPRQAKTTNNVMEASNTCFIFDLIVAPLAAA